MPINIYKNKTQINKDIFDSERELANTILFSPGPKKYGANSIKNNYPFPYYDSTYYDKLIRINGLKRRVIDLRSKYEKLDKEEKQKNNMNNSTNLNMNLRINNANDGSVENNKEFNSNLIFNFF